MDTLLLFVLGVVLSVSIGSFFKGIVSFVVGLVFGCKVYMFKYLFFDYIIENQVGKFSFGKCVPTCQYIISKKNMDKKEDKLYTVAVEVVYSLFVVGFIFLTYALWKKSVDTIYEDLIWILIGAACYLICSTVGYSIMMVQFFLTAETRLSSYTQNIVKSLQQGTSLEEIDMPSNKILNLKAHSTEILQYNSFRFIKAVWIHQYDELREIVEECDEILRKSEYLYVRSLTSVYYNMIFYYSYIERKPEKASFFYSLVKKDLENDMDSNGRRVLAYYVYYNHHNAEMAKQLVHMAKNNLSKFSSAQWERDYEWMLLEELEKAIY